MYDVIIVGGGPAGLTAAIYCGRANLKTLVLEPELEGGQMAMTMEIANYPGANEDDTGMDLAMRMGKQARTFGAEFARASVESLTLDGEDKVLATTDGEYRARAVIAATGSRPHTLGIPGEEKFVSRGISYCATCDGAFYQTGDVYVIGGGNSAVEEALYLSGLGAKVHIVHRRDQLRAEAYLADLALKDENIEILWNTELKEVLGDVTADGLVLYNNKEDKSYTVKKDDKPLGIFIYVGARPRTEFLADVLELDNGYVPVDAEQRTVVPGLFAAGDIVAKKFRQVINACGEGCTAAMAVALDHVREQK